MNKKIKKPDTEVQFSCKLPVKTVKLLKKKSVELDINIKDLVNKILTEYENKK